MKSQLSSKVLELLDTYQSARDSGDERTQLLFASMIYYEFKRNIVDGHTTPDASAAKVVSVCDESDKAYKASNGNKNLLYAARLNNCKLADLLVVANG